MLKNKKINKEIVAIIKEYINNLKKEKFPIKDVYLYGSYAKGTQTNLSDIDVCVISDIYLKNKDSNEDFLWKKVLAVDPRIEPVFYFSKDFNSVNPLVYEIKKYRI